MRKIKLLAPKELNEFAPEEYKVYVYSMHHKPVRKNSKYKKTKPYSVTINKKGTLVLRVNRKPKSLTEKEINEIAEKSGRTVNDILVLVRSKDIIISGE